MVYNFVLEQMFAAKKGGGATMNGDPIHVSQCTGKLSHQALLAHTSHTAAERTQALVVTALGNQRPEHMLRPKLDTIMDLAKDPNPVHG